MEVFYSKDCYLGGCIWEFADHSVYNDKGKYKFTYGGDHNEYLHDSNFCVDGLFSPIRDPHMGALNMKYEYRPFKSSIRDNILIISNLNCFIDSSEIAIEYSLQKNGEIIERNMVNEIVKPLNRIEISLNLPPLSGDVYIVVRYTDKKSQVIAEEQHCIRESLQLCNRECSMHLKGFMERVDSIDINYNNGRIVIDKDKGEIKSYVFKNIEMLKNSFVTNINRPYSDNSRLREHNVYKDCKVKNIRTVINKHNDGLRIEFNKEIHDKKHKFYDCIEIIDINSDGSIDIEMKLISIKQMRYNIECYGHIYKLPLSLDNVEYYGRGEGDNYPDIKDHCIIGNYRMKASDVFHKHIRPQESGSRTDVHKILITQDNGIGFSLLSIDKPFNISIRLHSDDEIDKAMHQEDLPKPQCIYLSLNGEVAGVGSGSCGPDVLDNYLISKKKTYVFRYKIKPLSLN